MPESLVESVAESRPARGDDSTHCYKRLVHRSAQLGISDDDLPGMTYHESKFHKPLLLQSFRERLPSRRMSLLASYNDSHYLRDTMSDSKGDDDATKPAVHQVECIVRDSKPADERVVPAGNDYQWDHLDECKSTGAISKMLQLGDYGAVPFNTVGAENEIHGDDPGE